MSSWDRSRHIPWSRVDHPIAVPSPNDGGSGGAPQIDDNFEKRKEMIFRELSREAAEEEQQEYKNSSEQKGDLSAIGNDDANTLGKKKVGVPYRTPDLLRNLAFGACIGSITGAVFGFMDGMRSAGESDVLKRASNAAKIRFLLQGTSRSGLIFGAFFAGFHGIKYGLRVALDPGEYTEMAAAGTFSIGALFARTATRPSVPYAGMLVGMDAFSTYMKNNPM